MGAYLRSGRRLFRSSTHYLTYLGPFLLTKVILNGAFTAGEAPTGEQRLRLLAPTKACNTSTSGSLLLIWVMASESWGTNAEPRVGAQLLTASNTGPQMSPENSELAVEDVAGRVRGCGCPRVLPSMVTSAGRFCAGKLIWVRGLPSGPLNRTQRRKIVSGEDSPSAAHTGDSNRIRETCIAKPLQ